MSVYQPPVHGPAPPSSVEAYVPVEEVAERLGLPLGILLRRVEAGDIPGRRVESVDGVRWSIRLSDLGIEPDTPAENGSAELAAPPGDELDVEEEPEHADLVGSAAPSAWPDKVVPPPAEELAAVARQNEAVHQRGAMTALTHGPSELRQEVASMMLDPRELVAGLLDRWERTLEQRIYAEQRQRFESELNARQNLVKQLQLELQTARAEHAAIQAERDRRLSEQERRIGQIQRELDAASEQIARRRGWFWRR
jgi:hypothetical protein